MSQKNDNFFETKKEWSKTKDSILGKYLRPYFSKLIAFGKPICYVDCFAGKGKFDDGNAGSPLIALDCINNSMQNSNYETGVYSYFIELNHHIDLKDNVTNFVSATQNRRIRSEVIAGKFEDNIDAILEIHRNNTVFLYIDPYGIKAIDIEKFNSFKLNDNKSVEMLINFNTWGFFREACRVLSADFKLDKKVEKYLIEYDPNNNLEISELSKIAGGDYWIDIVQRYKNQELSSNEAEFELSKGIAHSFNRKYKYVLNVPIKSSDDSRVPKYRLFHLTNHTDGCLLMADTMYNSIQEAILQQRAMQSSLFDMDAEGQFYSEEEIEDLITKELPKSNTRIDEFLCDFYGKNGLIQNTSSIRKIIKKFEANNVVSIERIPQFSKTGKPTAFMSEKGNKQFVYIRRK